MFIIKAEALYWVNPVDFKEYQICNLCFAHPWFSLQFWELFSSVILWILPSFLWKDGSVHSILLLSERNDCFNMLLCHGLHHLKTNFNIHVPTSFPQQKEQKKEGRSGRGEDHSYWLLWHFPLAPSPRAACKSPFSQLPKPPPGLLTPPVCTWHHRLSLWPKKTVSQWTNTHTHTHTCGHLMPNPALISKLFPVVTFWLSSSREPHRPRPMFWAHLQKLFLFPRNVLKASSQHHTCTCESCSGVVSRAKMLGPDCLGSNAKSRGPWWPSV